MGGSKVGWVGLVQNTPSPLINDAWCVCLNPMINPMLTLSKRKSGKYCKPEYCIFRFTTKRIFCVIIFLYNKNNTWVAFFFFASRVCNKYKHSD